MDRLRRSRGRSPRTPGNLYRMVPAIRRHPWRDAERLDRRGLSSATMTVQVLIFDVRGPQYRALLQKRFPNVGFHIGHHLEDADSVIANIDVIVGLGHHIPQALIARAKNLKWVQALTTGTETLTAPGALPPHVLLTSTRGVHGPQMSELAFLNMIALARNFRKMLDNQPDGKWEQWGQPILESKTIVIVGLGLLAEHL